MKETEWALGAPSEESKDHATGGWTSMVFANDAPAGDKLVAVCFARSRKRARARARLCAYAPELLAKCEKVAVWLNKIAETAEKQAAETTFITLKEACAADAKNYRATANEIQRLIDDARDA